MNAIHLISGAAFLVSLAVCLSLYRFSRETAAKFFLVAAPVGWGALFLWEFYAISQKWTIRVDLLLIFALLLGVSVSALVGAVRAFVGRFRTARRNDGTP